MNKQERNHLLLWLIAILLGIASSGCSTKKKSQQSDLEQLKTEQSSKTENIKDSSLNVKLHTELIVDDATETITTKKTFVVVDPSKPASVIDPAGNKHELNNANYIEETTKAKHTIETKKKDHAERFEKTVSKAKEESKGKVAAKKEVKKMDLERSGFSFWFWLWIAAIIVFCLLLVYLNQRFKVIKRVTAFFVK